MQIIDCPTYKLPPLVIYNTDALRVVRNKVNKEKRKMKTCIIISIGLLVACGVLCSADAPDECPWVCTADFSPVCARDAKGNTRTFSNRCVLKVYNECNDANTGAPPKNKFVEIYEGACRKS